MVLFEGWSSTRLSRPWSYPVILNTGHLDWESSALTTRPLIQTYSKLCFSRNVIYQVTIYWNQGIDTIDISHQHMIQHSS